MKKVLSLVLVLALVLGSFSMAFADTAGSALTDIESSANADAIVVVNDLGIVTGYPDGTFKGGNDVTRAEFAAMITRALAVPESALSGFTASTFTDTEGYAWAVPYLGYCASKGIMEGYGDGKVGPGDKITVNQAITMMCRALGYVNEAKELVGSWPANYISLAQSLDLYEDMAAVGTMDRQNAAQLIYNGLTKQLKYIDADGVTRGVSNGDKDTMLELLGGKVANGGYAFVLTSTQASTAVININEYVGSLVKAFTNNDDEIITVEVQSTELTGKYKANNEFVVGDDTYYLALADFDYTAVAANGSKTENVAPMLVDNGATNGTATAPVVGTKYTLNVNLSGKTIKEVYSNVQWNAQAPFEFAEDDLDLKKAKIKTFEFKTDNNNEIDKNTFILNGVANLTDIEEDDIVEVYLAGGKVSRVDVGQATVTGTVSKIDGDDYYINGAKYALVDGLAALGLGETGTASLTFGGDIAVWDPTDETAGNYAVIVKKGLTTDAYGNTTHYVTLFTKEGKEVEYVVHKDEVATVSGAAIQKAIYTYSVDKNGKLNDLNLVTATVLADGNRSFNEKHTLFENVPVNDSALVFLYNTTDEEWSLGTIAGLKDEYNWNADTYGVVAKDAKNKFVVFVATTAAKTSTDTYGLINAVSKQVDADGGKYWHVEGFLEGAALTAFTDRAADGAAGYAVPTTTDAGIQKITVDADGIVTNVTASGIGGVLTGKVKSVDTTKQFITLETGDAGTFGYDASVVVYLWDSEDEVFGISKVADLKGKQVKLYKSDADLDGYDIIVAW